MLRTLSSLHLSLAAAALAVACSADPAAPTGSETGGPSSESNSETDGGSLDEGGANANAEDGAPGGPSGPDGIRVLVEPSDNGAALLDAITNAKTSVHVTMYMLGDPRFVDALIARHRAGVDVKVILNHVFVNNAGTNTAVYDQLQAAGVSVAWAPTTFTLTHEKCVIVDSATAWIMTMNLQKSSPANREFLAVDTEPGDVAEAEAIFAADFANKAYTPQGNELVAPVNARARLVGLIQSAKKNLVLEGEELSDYQIVNALAAAKQRGVDVKVVLSDVTPTSAQQSAETQLKAAKVGLVKVSDPYIHAKAVVADGARAYVGSANFTTGSLQYNRELGIITTNAASVTTVAKTIAQDFANGK